MSDSMAYAAAVLRRCDELAAFSEDEGRLTRRFATPALWQAGEAVREWMEAAGMDTRRDAIGNVIGRLGENGRRTLLLGSHLDTVRDAGRYDGMLGVLVAIGCVERLRDQRRSLPYAVEVLAFADEEGVRYGTGYLGSSVVAGCFDSADLERRDAEGLALADALCAFGGDPHGLPSAHRDPADLIGYYEVHIEQGPVLESEGVPIGVVTAIAGQTGGRIVLTGAAGHAGTVPMAPRRPKRGGRICPRRGGGRARPGRCSGDRRESRGRARREERDPRPRCPQPRCTARC
jgi:allantoate deiminase